MKKTNSDMKTEFAFSFQAIFSTLDLSFDFDIYNRLAGIERSISAIFCRPIYRLSSAILA